MSELRDTRLEKAKALKNLGQGPYGLNFRPTDTSSALQKKYADLPNGEEKEEEVSIAGRITSRRKGGGVKKKYRLIDFKRNKFDMKAEVVRIEYDPNRSAFISLIKYEDGEFRYILSPQNIKIGDQLISGQNVEIKDGNSLPLKNIPVGTNVHNIELKPGAGGQLSRSAGSSVSRETCSRSSSHEP